MLIFFAILAFCAAEFDERNTSKIEENMYLDPGFVKNLARYWTAGNMLLVSEDNELPLAGYGIPEKSKIKVENKEIPIKDFVKSYKRRVLEKATDDIKSIIEYLRKKLYLKTKQVWPILAKATHWYTTKLKSFFTFLSHKEKYNEFDKQYILIDLVNVARFLLHSVGMGLQKDIFAIVNDLSHQDKVFITQTIVAHNMDFKKHELQHICRKMGVCRPYPAFSEYLASIINEILKVIDPKFQYLLVKSAPLLTSKRNLLETFLSKRVVKWFLKRAENVGKEVIMDMKEVFRKVLITLSLRHKMMIFEDGTMKKDKKALRILIDIIDKAFESGKHNYLVIQYGLTVTALQEWAQGTKADIDNTLSSFINYVAHILKLALSNLAKREMKVLSEIIFDGDPADIELAKYLLENGSKFVRGMDFDPEYSY